jgi:branched-chain amino acid transport system permease protein
MMFKKRVTFSTLGFIVIALVTLPLVISRTDILNLFLLVFLYITLTQSWNILGGYTGQISLGHAAFFGVGALCTRILWETGTPFFLAFPAGGLAAVVLAVIIGLPALRLKGIYFSIGTLGLTMIMRITVGNVFPTVSFMSASQLAHYSVIPKYYVALAVALAVCLTVYLLMNSKLGLGMLTVREDEGTAASSGINVFKHKVLALVLSSLFAGIAGSIFAYYYASYYYYVPFELDWAFNPVLVAFIGGVGTIIGPVIGAVIFVVLQHIFTLTLGEVHVVIFGALFIITVLLLPGGLYELIGKVQRLLTRTGKTKVLIKE